VLQLPRRLLQVALILIRVHETREGRPVHVRQEGGLGALDVQVPVGSVDAARSTAGHATLHRRLLEDVGLCRPKQPASEEVRVGTCKAGSCRSRERICDAMYQPLVVKKPASRQLARTRWSTGQESWPPWRCLAET